MSTEIKFETYDGNKPYIFVSYSHYDIDKVYPILNRLHDENFRIWFDDVMRVGHDFVEELKDRIAESSVFLVFVSSSSMKSKYCGMEIITAYKNNKNIYPIFVEDEVNIPDALEMIFENIQYVKITDLENDKKALMSVINSLPIETNTQLKPCISCGKGVKIGDTFCPRCGASQIPQRDEDISFKQDVGRDKEKKETSNIKIKEKSIKIVETDMPMKWYKYLVYFGLIADVVFYIIGCVDMLSTSFADPLLVINTFYGVGLILIIILAIITRNKLKNFYKIGPKYLNIYFILHIIINIIYWLGCIGLDDNANPRFAVIYLIVLIASNKYFKKRIHLFIN